MQPAGFLCPECSVPLRLNDRSQIGREIDCPDCGKRLMIVGDAGQVRAVRAAQSIGLELPRRPGPRNSLRLIWAATACLGIVIVWIASRPSTTETRVEKTKFEEASPASRESSPVAVVETPKPELPPIVDAPAIELPKLPALPPVEAPPVAAAAADARPLVPELAPDLPPVDVAAQLSLKIEEYSQTKPVQVRLLLRQVAELSAVPVDLSAVEKDPWKTKLDQQITVALKATTVEGILADVLRQAGLRWQMQQEAITILPLE